MTRSGGLGDAITYVTTNQDMLDNTPALITYLQKKIKGVNLIDSMIINFCISRLNDDVVTTTTMHMWSGQCIYRSNDDIVTFTTVHVQSGQYTCR
ncbi:Uncharacterized protein TCM_017671 [Theobroma cacao]|uniref:Uncharacterized protein n=1 Tax=Theobroma cacao TaxID=3641 RepID=A0A061ELE8_THECC|nr:Uncharacterized protein TCM_017671 [Theobroma cacao]